MDTVVSKNGALETVHKLEVAKKVSLARMLMSRKGRRIKGAVERGVRTNRSLRTRNRQLLRCTDEFQSTQTPEGTDGEGEPGEQLE